MLVKLAGLEKVISSSSSYALFLAPPPESTLSLLATLPPTGGTYPGGSPSLILDPVGDVGMSISILGSLAIDE